MTPNTNQAPAITAAAEAPAHAKRVSYLAVLPGGAIGLDFKAWRGQGTDDLAFVHHDREGQPVVTMGPGRRGSKREVEAGWLAIAPPWAPTKEGKAKLVRAKLGMRKCSQRDAIAQLRGWEPRRERAKRIAARRRALVGGVK